jgi:O-antigen/teichoic acid export membrane protein
MRIGTAARRLTADNGLLGRFGYLLASQCLGLIFGVGYWTVTAKNVPAREVGLVAAAMSIGALLSTLGGLGIGSIMLVELGRSRHDARRIIAIGITIGGTVVAALALACWAASPVLGPSMRTIGRNALDGTLFVVGSGLIGVATVLDSASIGLRRARVQLYRNGVQGAIRLAAVVVAVSLGLRSASALLAIWVGSIAVSLSVCPVLFRTALVPKTARPPTRWLDIVRRYGRLALSHYVLNVAITSIGFLLPFIAALFVVPRELAYFSVAQLVSTSVMLPPALLAMTLFAEATDDDAMLRRHIRRTIPVGFACCVVGLAVFEPGASLVLGVFNRTYATHGTIALRLLLLGGLPYVLKDHFVSIKRARRELRQAARVVALATTVELSGAVVGALLDGVTGLCAGWVIGAGIEALGFAPVVFRAAYGRTTPHPRYRSRPPARTYAGAAQPTVVGTDPVEVLVQR